MFQKKKKKIINFDAIIVVLAMSCYKVVKLHWNLINKNLKFTHILSEFHQNKSQIMIV